jgi:hypothetical protein
MSAAEAAGLSCPKFQLAQISGRFAGKRAEPLPEQVAKHPTGVIRAHDDHPVLTHLRAARATASVREALGN